VPNVVHASWYGSCVTNVCLLNLLFLRVRVVAVVVVVVVVAWARQNN
jgi:hypothetical protein